VANNTKEIIIRIISRSVYWD